ncbi:hypothetical protein H8356DRAFT_1275302 [Neocallimastix lanati (nom. inval.)]|nr:hypothetical protein H8356DRAFT_1275302 [Neocallimastix sp. JGI-2020a]
MVDDTSDDDYIEDYDELTEAEKIQIIKNNKCKISVLRNLCREWEESNTIYREDSNSLEGMLKRQKELQILEEIVETEKENTKIMINIKKNNPNSE